MSLTSSASFGKRAAEIKYVKPIVAQKNTDLFLFDTVVGALDIGIRQ